MAREVPAYKKFLQQSGVRASDIRTLDDLCKVPPIDKNNYLRASNYNDLFWNGSLRFSHILTSTSGSTGEPFYFARSHAVDEQSALVHERFLLQSSLQKTRPTLVIVCFGMGVWIGGLITYQAFELLGKRGHPVSIITPGINKTEILKILRRLAPRYDQVILAGYPPFIKDVIDAAIEDGIDMAGRRMGIILAAEAFSERFRDYIATKTGIKNVYTDIMNIYGSADLGTMAAETPLSILVRRIAKEDDVLFASLFGQITKTPTLAQFDPSVTCFEEHDGQLFVSGDSAMPLVRYAIGDNGGVLSFSEIASQCKARGVDLRKKNARGGNTGIECQHALCIHI